MRRITEAMHQFRTAPEDESGSPMPSQRRDEIGIAQRELQRMQSDLRLALHEKTRLAELGAAVTKITHDLRNILSTAQLVSDRLADSKDPTVKRVTPTLLASLDRAISLCVNTLSFAREEKPVVAMTRFSLGLLVDDVGAALRLPLPETSRWINEVPREFWLRADRDQMFRVLLNLGRNAYEAGATKVTVSARRGEDGIALEIADNGQGIAAGRARQAVPRLCRHGKAGGYRPRPRHLARAPARPRRRYSIGREPSRLDAVPPHAAREVCCRGRGREARRLTSASAARAAASAFGRSTCDPFPHTGESRYPLTRITIVGERKNAAPALK